MVAKKAAGVAGTFAGGILNNPGALAAIGIVVSIVTTLVIFRNDIRNFFGTTIPEALSGIGQIQLPSIEFPDITFPTFEFPDITFPDITFPSFDFQFPSFEDLFMVPEPFVGPERMDVPLDPTDPDSPIIDIVPDVTGGRGERLAGVIGPPQQTIEELFPDQPVSIADFIARFATPAEQFAIEERGAIPEGFGITTFGGEAVLAPVGGQVLAEPEPEVSFAESIVPETQEEFQERAGAFAEAFPELTAATSLDGIRPGPQLAREQEDFQSVLEAEAARSESIFASLFGSVQNPEFGA